MTLRGNAHLIAHTVSYFLFLFIVRGFDLIMPRGIPPLRQLSAHLNTVNRRAAPKMGHDISALTATYSRSTGQSVKRPSLTQSSVSTDILKNRQSVPSACRDKHQ